jgi:hypothetical protein
MVGGEDSAFWIGSRRGVDPLVVFVRSSQGAVRIGGDRLPFARSGYLLLVANKSAVASCIPYELERAFEPRAGDLRGCC